MTWGQKLRKAADKANEGDTEKLESYLMDKAEDEGHYGFYISWNEFDLTRSQLEKWADKNNIQVSEVDVNDNSCYLSWEARQ